MYRLRWYCWAFLSGGRCSELHPIYHGCRALTFALARLFCLYYFSTQWLLTAMHSLHLSALYRALHYCIARYWDCMSSVRLSVCLSVTLVDQDHIGWQSWKLIAQTISATFSLFVAQKTSVYSQGNMRKFGETRGQVEKSDVLEHKSGNISETRKELKIEEKLPWRAYRKSQTLFRTVLSPTPYGLPSPRLGFATPPQNCNRYYLRNG